MVKYLRLILTLALIPLVAPPSVAEDALLSPAFQRALISGNSLLVSGNVGNSWRRTPSFHDLFSLPIRGNSLLVSGNVDEKLEIALFLDRIGDLDGENQKNNAANCEASFTLDARDATGTSSVVFSDDIDLAEGDFDTLEVDFGLFASEGQAHVILTISDVHFGKGPCQLLPTARLVDKTTGATISVARILADIIVIIVIICSTAGGGGQTPPPFCSPNPFF